MRTAAPYVLVFGVIFGPVILAAMIGALFMIV